MAEAFDAVGFLSKILAENGPLDEDDIVRRLEDSGVVDPEDVMVDCSTKCLPSIEIARRTLVLAADGLWAGVHPSTRRRRGSPRSAHRART